MQRAPTWKSWDLSKSYYKRHVYEADPEEPPPYEDDAPEIDWRDVPSTSRELLCSRCMLAVLKIYSDRQGTGAFGLFLPATESCILCNILAEVQKSSVPHLGYENRISSLMRIRRPFPNLSRAPPAHMKDLLVLWDDAPNMNVTDSGARVMTKKIEVDGTRAIPRQQVDPLIVRSWLRQCEDEHGDACCAAINKEHRSGKTILLIDVRHFCLVRKTLPCRYVALSYVWGRVPTFRLKEQDVDSLAGIAGLRAIQDQLPRTIMDAIEFVQSMEESYLWVDSVCIPQDNAREMEEQVGHMASIYRSALLTLVAIESKDASSPLPGVRRGSRSLRSFFQSPDVTLSERMPSIVPVISSSHYNTRSWTFQERLLSSRCLYFTAEQVFLQCHTGIFREDRVACTAFEKIGRDAIVLKPFSPAFIEAASPTNMTGVARNHMLYRQIVEEYTLKSLSFDSDILRAFTGVAEELQPLIETPIVAGLPEKFFVRALLFQPRRASFVKRTADMKHLDSKTNELINLKFPSWSWSGWVGPVEYRKVGSIISNCSRFQVCTSAIPSKQVALFRPLAESVEPISPDSEQQLAFFSKIAPDVQPFAVRFVARVDAASNLKLEDSARGPNYRDVIGVNGLKAGLIRVDDPSNYKAVRAKMEENNLSKKEVRREGIVLLCDIEQELIKQPDEPNTSLRKTFWGPKLYHDGKPWKLCAVLFVNWKSQGVAERLGIGEVAKSEWQKADAINQAVYLV